MVVRLTLGKEKYKAAWPELAPLVDRLDDARVRLLELIDEDTKAFDAVVAARRLPKEPRREGRSGRRRAVDVANLLATTVPMQTAFFAHEALKVAPLVLEKGNPNAASDAWVAALSSTARRLGALANVRINLPGVSDPGAPAGIPRGRRRPGEDGRRGAREDARAREDPRSGPVRRGASRAAAAALAFSSSRARLLRGRPRIRPARGRLRAVAGLPSRPQRTPPPAAAPAETCPLPRRRRVSATRDDRPDGGRRRRRAARRVLRLVEGRRAARPSPSRTRAGSRRTRTRAAPTRPRTSSAATLGLALQGIYRSLGKTPDQARGLALGVVTVTGALIELGDGYSQVRLRVGGHRGELDRRGPRDGNRRVGLKDTVGLRFGH